MINEFDSIKLLFESQQVNQLLHELKFPVNESPGTNVSANS